MNSIKIAGLGSCIPKKILKNSDLEKTLDTSDEWIVTRTGMRERRIASKNKASSDLAIGAAREAIRSAEIKAKDVDLIIVATATPDMIFPSTACLVQTGIDAKNAAAYDISAVCSGFIYALSVAEQYIRSGKYKTILVIGSEVMSRIVDWTDRTTCILFGDGAGAVVLTHVPKSRKNDVFYTHIDSAGAHASLLCVPGGGGRHPVSHEIIEKRLHYIKMEGNKIFKLAVKSMTTAAREALKANSYTIADIDIVIPHQANIRIIKALADVLEIPAKKVFINIEKYGNTSAASIPIALTEAVGQGRIKKGSLVLMVAFGGGLTWGSALVRW